MGKRYLAAIISAAVALSSALVLVAAVGAPEKPEVTDIVVSAPVAANPVYVEADTRVVAVEDNREQAQLDMEKISKLVQLNRVFDDYIYCDTALIEEAQITLLDKVEFIGDMCCIDKSAVDSLVLSMYGRAVGEGAYEVEGFDVPDGYYAVVPRGFDGIKYSNISAERMADGRVSVAADVEVDGLNGVESFSVNMELSAAENEYGYIIVSAKTNR